MRNFLGVPAFCLAIFLPGCSGSPEVGEEDDGTGKAGPGKRAWECTFAENDKDARLNEHYTHSRYGRNCPYAGQPGSQLVCTKVVKNLTADGKVASFSCPDVRHKSKKKSAAYVCLGLLDQHPCDCKGQIHDWHLLTFHDFHCVEGHGIGRPVWRAAAKAK